MKFLAYTSPARGHLYPTMPILHELQRRGHVVAVRTLDAEVDHLRQLGFTADRIDPRIARIEFDDYLARSAVGAIKRSIRTMSARAAFEVGDLQAAIESEAPDVLLIDGNAVGAVAVAEAWGGPWALLQHFPTPLPADEIPPFGPGLHPARGALGRMRDRLLRPLILGGFERVMLPPLNEVRGELGLRPLRDAADLYTRAPLTLYVTSTAFEYPRTAWPDSFCLTGPLAWDPPADRPGWLDTVRRPLVLVTTSSEFQDDGVLVETALAALAHEDCGVVATMPAGSIPHQVPANARVEAFVPHTPLLEIADVAVTHGGMGATQKALCAGVPVVVVPWGRDQSEVGRRAEAAGVGVLLPKRKLSPRTLRDAVARARALGPAASAFADAMKREGGARLAAERLEQLAARERPVHHAPHAE
ncbi:nucleotide disphospho-sugar-binding domain-containing protein [Agromyces neolithicus]|uniref:Glycosyltransferase n=1 Tax=Agromyces neolithicus TaxID=269420 RepID=A0ABN2LZW5_9MICO